MPRATNRTILQRAFLLFALALLVYVAPLVFNALVTPFFHAIPSQDVVGASLVPMSVITRGNFYLDQYRRYIANNYVEQHFAADVNGHLVSLTPVMAGVLAVPFMGAGVGSGWIARTVHVFDVAKLAAALITAVSVIAFFFTASELSDLATSTFASFAFAFGSAVWVTASQGLWQHTPSVLFQSIALWYFARGIRRGPTALIPAGLYLSLAVISRPPVLVIALALALYVLFHARRALVPFVLSVLPPLALALVYNTLANGSPLVFGYQEGVADHFAFPTTEAIQGLLFSPSRGLFVFSPFLLLAPWGLVYGWVHDRRPLYVYLALAALAYLLVMAAWGSLGGWAYGARMLTDILPAMCLLIAPAVERMAKWRGALWGIALFAALVSSLGVWDYGVRFHADPANSVWSIENNEPLFYLRQYMFMFQEFSASLTAP